MLDWSAEQPSDVTAFPPGGQGIRRIVERDRRLAREGFQQPGMGAFFLTPTGTARGICWLQHGFTAGPYQFWQLAKQLAHAGWYVFAPRLPGHGYQKGDREDSGLLPRSSQAHRYLECAITAARAVCAVAHAHPGGRLPVVAVGLSGGAVGLLGLLAQQQHQQSQHVQQAPACHIDGMVLVAPYIQPYAYVVQTAFRAAKCLDVWGMAGRALDAIPYGWTEDDVKNARAWQRPGHTQFLVGNVFALEKAKDQALRALWEHVGAQTGVLPAMQLVVSDADRRISTPAAVACMRELFAMEKGSLHGRESVNGSGKNVGLQILRFPREAAVPHAMLSPMEHPDDARREEILNAIVAFVRGVTVRW